MAGSLLIARSITRPVQRLAEAASRVQQGDYTRWFRDAIKDGELAGEAQRAESDSDPARSRTAVMEAVKRRYAAANLD